MGRFFVVVVVRPVWTVTEVVGALPMVEPPIILMVVVVVAWTACHHHGIGLHIRHRVQVLRVVSSRVVVGRRRQI